MQQLPVVHREATLRAQLDNGQRPPIRQDSQ